jgi:hypothetical protein
MDIDDDYILKAGVSSVFAKNVHELPLDIDAGNPEGFNQPDADQPMIDDSEEP